MTFYFSHFYLLIPSQYTLQSNKFTPNCLIFQFIHSYYSFMSLHIFFSLHAIPFLHFYFWINHADPSRSTSYSTSFVKTFWLSQVVWLTYTKWYMLLFKQSILFQWLIQLLKETWDEKLNCKVLCITHGRIRTWISGSSLILVNNFSNS